MPNKSNRFIIPLEYEIICECGSRQISPLAAREDGAWLECLICGRFWWLERQLTKKAAILEPRETK